MVPSSSNDLHPHISLFVSCNGHVFAIEHVGFVSMIEGVSSDGMVEAIKVETFEGDSCIVAPDNGQVTIFNLWLIR